MILVIIMLRRVIRNPSKLPALAGFLTISASVLIAGLSSSSAYAAMGVTRVCPIDDQQKLVAELTGNNQSFVAPGATVSYVEQIYNPGPETYQEVLTSTQLDPYLTPKHYPAGTVVRHVGSHYVLSGQSDIPMAPGATRSQTLTAVVGQKAVSAGAQLQAWGISETLNGATCDVAQPVIVIIHRVPRGAPHTGDGSMATKFVGRPAHDVHPHKTRRVGKTRRALDARRAGQIRHAREVRQALAVRQAREIRQLALTSEHLTFTMMRAGHARPITVTVTITVAPTAAHQARSGR